MNITQELALELNIKQTQVESTIKLIDEGNTIPFIARYRKEVTGGLSDETLRDLGERLTYLRNLETRKSEVVKSIEEQNKMTEEIALSIEKAKTLAEVEDIYRPYKPKKKTRATIAKAKGLEPLAEIIYAQSETKPIEEQFKEHWILSLKTYQIMQIIEKLLKEFVIVKQLLLQKLQNQKKNLAMKCIMILAKTLIICQVIES